jgi:predicted DNA-binding transcriptional regulator YafY
MLLQPVYSIKSHWNVATVTIINPKSPLAIIIQQHIMDTSQIAVRYSRSEDPDTVRSIVPLRLFKRRGSDMLYVEAFCKKANDNRVFELSWLSLA